MANLQGYHFGWIVLWLLQVLQNRLSNLHSVTLKLQQTNKQQSAHNNEHNPMAWTSVQ